MTNSKISYLAAVIGLVLCRQLAAFSLLGPFDTWQTADLGYHSPFTVESREGDAGGPMNIGEEYRWTTPIITYGFDPSFIEYFGPKGVAAIEAAFKTLNDLPAHSTTDDGLSGFALSTSRFNPIANQLGLVDLKSVALSSLLETLGLGAPERWTYCFRSRSSPGTFPGEIVIERNFDPFTFQPSPRINGTLYTYQIVNYTANGQNFWEPKKIVVDTTQPNLSVVAFAGVESGLVESKVYAPLYGQRGTYYTGLSRDDMGGLRYIYSLGNRNVERPPTDALLATQSPNGATGVVDLSTELASSPWRLIINGALASAANGTTGAGGTTGTGTTGTGSSTLAGVLVPFPYGTLINVDSTTTGTTGAGANAASNSVSQIAINGYRQGVDKISFVNVSQYYDPLLMVSTNGYLVSYDETVVKTNGITVKQRIGRLQPHPDIVISATDVGVDPTFGYPYLYSKSFASSAYFVKSTGATISGQPAQSGPGTIDPDATGNVTGSAPIEISFNKLGNFFLNSGQTGQADGLPGFMWGSFDGTSGNSSDNPIAVFPPNVDIRAYSRGIFGN